MTRRELLLAGLGAIVFALAFSEPLLGNPRSRFLTPSFGEHLLFGPVVRTHLEVPLQLAIA